MSLLFSKKIGMNKESIEAVLHEEYEISKREYNDLVAESAKVTDKIEKSIQFYERYCSNLQAFINSTIVHDNMIKTILEKPEELLAPGYPGSDFKNFTNFFLLINGQLNQFQTIRKTLHDTIINRLKIINSEFNSGIQYLSLENQKVANIRNAAIQAYSEINEKIATQANTIEILYSKFQDSKSEKMKNKLSKACEEYQIFLGLRNQRYKEMRTAHIKAIQAYNDSVYRIKMLELSRSSNHKETIQFHSKIIADCIKKTEHIIEKFHAVHRDWNEDINIFLMKTGISRSSWKPLEFVPPKFSFEDSRIDSPLPPKPGFGNPAPIAMCQAINDYSPTHDGEVSASKGDRFYVFDNLTGPNSYVCCPRGEGFIPSTAIHKIEGEYYLVTTPTVALEEGFLSASAGEILRFISDCDGSKMFENLKGMVGKVPDDYIVSF